MAHGRSGAARADAQVQQREATPAEADVPELRRQGARELRVGQVAANEEHSHPPANRGGSQRCARGRPPPPRWGKQVGSRRAHRGQCALGCIAARDCAAIWSAWAPSAHVVQQQCISGNNHPGPMPPRHLCSACLVSGTLAAHGREGAGAGLGAGLGLGLGLGLGVHTVAGFG